MTFSQRRRYISLLWSLVSNAVFPFIMGAVLTLITATHTFVESFSAFDKSGLGICVIPTTGEGKQ